MKQTGASKSPAARSVVRTRRTFSEEYKRDALALAQQRRRERVSWAQIGRELDLRPTLLHQWAQQFAQRDGGRQRVEMSPSGLPGETVEEENRRLRRENAILREEREFAKKAAAFFAKESL
jgi:transposase